MTQLYDEIGLGYSGRRKPDPRVAAVIVRALGNAKSVVNVGAGAGSYEPSDREVVAVEPSAEMIRQRPHSRSPVVRASAASLPFRDSAFDASLAVLTVHHWSDHVHSLAEFARVSRSVQVIVTWDPAFSGFWLVEDYFPEIGAIDRRIFPSLDEIRQVLGEIVVWPIPIPHDCSDGFLGAYWRRPHAYLNPDVRLPISTFSRISNVDSGLDRLRSDLGDGTWGRKYGHLNRELELDLGYRVVASRSTHEST